MPLDNDMYDRLSHTWWEDGSFLNFLKAGLNPVRFGYMRRVLTESVGVDPRRLSVLDVGCGGGLLAEEFARLGCRVTGVDPSEKSIEEARRQPGPPTSRSTTEQAARSSCRPTTVLSTSRTAVTCWSTSTM